MNGDECVWGDTLKIGRSEHREVGTSGDLGPEPHETASAKAQLLWRSFHGAKAPFFHRSPRNARFRVARMTVLFMFEGIIRTCHFEWARGSEHDRARRGTPRPRGIRYRYKAFPRML